MTPEDLSLRLRDLLRGELHQPSLEVTDLRRLTGGASRETWSFTAGGERFVLQRERAGSPRAGAMALEADLLRAAEDHDVPVAAVIAAGAADPVFGAGFLVSRFVTGESIARKILRDDDFATARSELAGQCGRALAAIHSIPVDAVDGLVATDQVAQYREVLDTFGDAVPAFELAFRWLEDNRPAGTGQAVVHGDFRLGNLLVGADGLRAVVDWELAHLGDPMEDLGWLCVRAWRFGGELPVGGVGSYEQLFDAYERASGKPVDAAVVRWWEVLGTLKWGIMCIMQARAHLDGHSRSVELAAIGRRVCENEHDLLLLLAPEALADALSRPAPSPHTVAGMHGRPTAAELVEAVREYVEGDVMGATEGRVRFHARVAANALATVQRELELGPAIAGAQAERMAALGVAGEVELAAAIRARRLTERADDVTCVVAETVVDKLRVANPGYATPVG